MKRWMLGLLLCGLLIGERAAAAPWNTAGWTREQLQQRLTEQNKGQEVVRTALRRLQEDLALRQGNGASAGELQALTKQLNELRTADVQAQRYMSYLRQQLAEPVSTAPKSAATPWQSAKLYPGQPVQQPAGVAHDRVVDMNQYRICDLCRKGHGIKRTSGQWLCDNCQHELDGMRNVAEGPLTPINARKPYTAGGDGGRVQAALDAQRERNKYQAGGDGGRVQAALDAQRERNKYIADADRNVDEELALKQQRLLDGNRNVAEELARARNRYQAGGDGGRVLANQAASGGGLRVLDGDRNVGAELAQQAAQVRTPASPPPGVSVHTPPPGVKVPPSFLPPVSAAVHTPPPGVKVPPSFLTPPGKPASGGRRILDADRNVDEELALQQQRLLDGNRNVDAELARNQQRLLDGDRNVAEELARARNRYQAGGDGGRVLAGQNANGRLRVLDGDRNVGAELAQQAAQVRTPAPPPPGVSVHTPPPGVKVPPSFLSQPSAAVHVPPPGVKVPPSFLSDGGKSSQPLAQEIYNEKDGIASIQHIQNALPPDYEKRLNTRVAGTGVPDTAAGPAPGVAVHTPPPGVKVPPSFLGATGGGHIPPPGVKVPPSVLSGGGQPLAEEILTVKDGVATLTHVDNAMPDGWSDQLANPSVKVPASFLGATGGGHIPPPGVKVPPSVLSAGGQPLAEEILRVKDGVATLTHVDNALPADYEKRLNTLTVAKEQQVSLGRGVLESGTRTVAEKKETILGNVLTATTSASTFDELSHQQKMIREIQANDLKMYDDMIAQKRKEGVRPEVIAELEKRRYWTEKDMWNRQKIVAGLQGAAPPPAPPPPASLDPADYGKMTIYPEIDGAAAVMSSTASLRDMETPLAAMTGDAQLSTSALQSMVAGWQEQTTARVNAAHGLIALNTAKDRISEETDNKIREAENQKQQAHQAAIKTVRDAANSRANDQVANSWGTKVGDALIVDGLTAGGKNFGSTFGTSAATHVGTRLFPTKPASSGNTTGSGGGTASGGSSGGGTGWSSAPSSGGHGGGGGDDHHGGGGGGNSGGGGPDVVNTQNNGDGTITVTYSCGNTWTGKPPAPPKCPKCNEGTLASGTPSGGANTNITMTVEGYDLTCSECGKVTKILKSQAIPKQCPYCGDVKPQGGTVMGSGPAVTMTTNITSGGAGSKELYNAGRGMIQCSYCGRNWYCSSCAANASNSNVREKHAHICPYCNNRKNTGVQPNSGDGLIDAFCPIHRIKYGGRIRDNPKCPQCEAEKNQVWDAMCPNGHGKYGGRGPVTGCPRCAQIYGPGFIR